MYIFYTQQFDSLTISKSSLNSTSTLNGAFYSTYVLISSLFAFTYSVPAMRDVYVTVKLRKALKVSTFKCTQLKNFFSWHFISFQSHLRPNTNGCEYNLQTDTCLEFHSLTKVVSDKITPDDEHTNE